MVELLLTATFKIFFVSSLFRYITKMVQAKDVSEKDYKNFLSACHALALSKTGKDYREVLDIERRRLALKYFGAKTMDSEDTALLLLQRGLSNYRDLMEKENYWERLKTQTVRDDCEISKWTSQLSDTQDALNFIKPLQCRKDNTLGCKSKTVSDCQVKSIISIWKNEGSMDRPRKIRTCNENDIQTMDDVESSRLFRSKSVGENSVNIVFQTSKSLLNQNSVPSISSDPYNSTIRKPTIKPRSVETNEELNVPMGNFFKSARAELNLQRARANKPPKKTLGGKAPINSQFVCPFKREKEKEQDDREVSEENDDERLKNIDPKMIELIKNEIMDSSSSINWDDIAGLQYAKKIIKEVVVLPMLRPDIFTGLRRPPRGILLFGPPGTGKTLIGKCIASQSKSTFFSISASSLTSKWIGEGEKMVRALFAVARVHQPSVVFIDEIDSLLSQRSETEHESSRRLKTEFLVQLDGATTTDDDRILIVGATNRPHELDEAARRRLVKRLYIPLPEREARIQIVTNLLRCVSHNLTQNDILEIAKNSEGYSGADMTNLCKEASMEPIRSIPFERLGDIKKEDVRQVTAADFTEALSNVRPSVSQSDLSIYVEWDGVYGSGTAQQNYRS